MQKLAEVLANLGIAKVEDTGDGNQKVTLLKPDFLFGFVEWYNEWLFKKETERVVITEVEIRVLKGVLHFAKKLTKNDKGQVKVNLTVMQNESMKELGFLIKTEETFALIEKKIMGDQMMEEGGALSSMISPDELDKIVPYWEIIYALGKVRR